MIEFLLIVIIAILLLGSSRFIGVIGALAGLVVLAVALAVASSRTGISPVVVLLGFLGLLGLFAVLKALGVFDDSPPAQPKPNPPTPEQRRFLGNIDEYHRVKDQLYASKTELVGIKASRDAEGSRIKALENDIRLLENRLKDFGG